MFSEIKPKYVAIIIPCYNEEKTIGNVLKNFKKELYNIIKSNTINARYTIYPVDNNSTDATWYEMNDAAFGLNYIKPMKCFQQGKGALLRQMFNQINADIYVIIDGDSTYSASDLLELIKPIYDKEVDVTIGDRLSSTYFKENKRPFHNCGNKLVNALINMIYHSDVKDTMSGYRAYSKTFVKSFTAIKNNFETETEMTMFMLENGFSYKNIVIDYKDRPNGSMSKLNTYKDGYKVLKTIFNKYLCAKPLTIFGLIGLLTLLYGIVFAHNSSVYLYITIGIVMICTGIIGQIVSSQAQEIKRIQINLFKSKQ